MDKNMSRADIRLELLKLTHNTVHPAEQIIARTKEFEAYVTEVTEEKVSQSVAPAVVNPAPENNGGKGEGPKGPSSNKKGDKDIYS